LDEIIVDKMALDELTLFRQSGMKAKKDLLPVLLLPIVFIYNTNPIFNAQTLKQQTYQRVVDASDFEVRLQRAF
jgi:hypothetical protein